MGNSLSHTPTHPHSGERESESERRVRISAVSVLGDPVGQAVGQAATCDQVQTSNSLMCDQYANLLINLTANTRQYEQVSTESY